MTGAAGHESPSATCVLDASAVLALLNEEPGADEVESRLDGAVMSTVNLSEVLQKVWQHDIDTEGLEHDLAALGLEFVDFDVRDARAAADMWARVSRGGLSLGDRACLAAAESFGVAAVTTDRRWASIENLGVAVEVIR